MVRGAGLRRHAQELRGVGKLVDGRSTFGRHLLDVLGLVRYYLNLTYVFPAFARFLKGSLVSGVVARAVRDVVAVPLGIQILAGANQQALAVTRSSGADYVRAENFVFAHVADEGLVVAM